MKHRHDEKTEGNCQWHQSLLVSYRILAVLDTAAALSAAEALAFACCLVLDTCSQVKQLCQHIVSRTHTLSCCIG